MPRKAKRQKKLTIHEIEKELILRVLKIEGGNLKNAAKRLGIREQRLHEKLEEYGIAH